MSAIDDKYAALGGAAGFLGEPFDAGAGSAEMDTSNGKGRCRDFQRGSIVWSPATGAHEVHGRIRDKWAALGGERGFLGFPLTDESPTLDGRGRFNQFEGDRSTGRPRPMPTKSTGQSERRGQRSALKEVAWGIR
jgi:uncharacterized protein with LGFP repeats